jgi:hypothetical protein
MRYDPAPAVSSNRAGVFRRVSVAACAALLIACHRKAAERPPVAVAEEPLSPLPAALYEAQLPVRLEDSTYWRMVREFSEPGGYFQSENFVSNEMGLQHVIAPLERYAPPGGVYVGVGPEQNFTYLGALRPRLAFIVDIRRQNLLQHLWYKAVFELSPTRAEFLSRLFARPLRVADASALSADSLIALLDRAPIDTMMFRRVFDDARRHLVVRHGFTLDSTDLATMRYVDSIFVSSGPTLNYSSGSTGRMRGGFNRMPTFAQIAGATDQRGVNRGFLGNEANYQYVRDLQRRNLVVPVVGNFGGPKALRAVGNWLRERNARVNVFYTSNVEQYLFGDNLWQLFYNNVGAMPVDSSSRFIRSSTNRGFGSPSGFMMTQLTSSILDVVRGAQAGTVRDYGDVLRLSTP